MDFTKYAPLITATATIAGAITGAFITYFLTRKNALKIAMRHEFVKAALTFKYILEEDVERLKTLPANEEFFTQMEKRFDSYEKAMIGLKINLPDRIVGSFEQAWEKYEYAGNDKQWAKDVHLATFHIIRADENSAKQTTLSNIAELLKFCNPDYVFK
jgi:hypothetical protein